ncbi:hypothetical protein FZEAL_9018 [Fusarium zealandicum]|uniref:WD repeat-containing protein n=1 Tax=Fusarium zealandicum TaxID=1053134 RepID=A0A8H4XH41_9HYPO|nr:hypothetical protein FZEAL_9018 [Fusarium zealandicum]
MRRAALSNKSHNNNKDRQLYDAPSAVDHTAAVAASSATAVEALLRDESFQAHHHDLVTLSVSNQPPAPVSVSVTANDVDSCPESPLDHDRHLHLQNQNSLHPASASSHAVSATALDAPMTDAFPARLGAVSATAATTATNTTSSAFATAASTTTFTASSIAHPSHQNDHDGQATASITNARTCSDEPTESDLDTGYVHQHHDEDYDLDMSDSEGGAPLDDDDDDDDDIHPYPQVDHHHYTLTEEDHDAHVPGSGPVNYLVHPFSQLPTLAEAGIIMDAPPPPGPWAPMPTNAVPVPQAFPQPLVPPIDPLDDPAPISNPNPVMLGSQNLGLVDFLRHWAHQARTSSPTSASRAYAPCPEDIRRQAHHHINEVAYNDLRGDDFDMQGMDWASMGTTRRHARQKRCATYKNYVNKEGSDRWSPHMADVNIPSSESFLRFKKYHVRQDVYLAHFQLRSVLACPSRTQAFYPGTRGVNRINPITGKTELALNCSEASFLGGLISALDANHGILLAGAFNGEYYLKNLESEDKKTYSDGQITQNQGGITNHVQVHLPRRSSGPVAAISSNDEEFRVMDLATEKFVLQKRYRFPLNCSRISPDGRLRAMVGDDFKVIITDADTGNVQQELAGHRDYGFSCDWSDDGWTVATGFQDKGVKIWDARRWCNSRGVSTPLCTIRSEMAGVRNLRFSPVGSGERVLVAAEEADYVNIINAQTFGEKQTVDVFGEIGGVAFGNDGQDLNVLVSDTHRGGLLQLERCGVGPEPYFRKTWQRFTHPDTDQWRNRLDDYSHIGEPYSRRPISTDALPIF